jgi:hypothetical protein
MLNGSAHHAITSFKDEWYRNGLHYAHQWTAIMFFAFGPLNDWSTDWTNAFVMHVHSKVISANQRFYYAFHDLWVISYYLTTRMRTEGLYSIPRPTRQSSQWRPLICIINTQWSLICQTYLPVYASPQFAFSGDPPGLQELVPCLVTVLLLTPVRLYESKTSVSSQWRWQIGLKGRTHYSVIELGQSRFYESLSVVGFLLGFFTISRFLVSVSRNILVLILVFLESQFSDLFSTFIVQCLMGPVWRL